MLLCLSFSSPIPSSNQRHQHLIRSSIAATLPCERALSISENLITLFKAQTPFAQWLSLLSQTNHLKIKNSIFSLLL
jgi:hypothetical protein